MSAYEFVQQQLREDFAIASRLSEELVCLRERLARAEMKIQRLEEALETQKSDSDVVPESGIIAKSDTVIVKRALR